MTWPLPEAEPNTDEVLSYENTRCLWYLKKSHKEKLSLSEWNRGIKLPIFCEFQGLFRSCSCDALMLLLWEKGLSKPNLFFPNNAYKSITDAGQLTSNLHYVTRHDVSGLDPLHSFPVLSVHFPHLRFILFKRLNGVFSIALLARRTWDSGQIFLSCCTANYHDCRKLDASFGGALTVLAGCACISPRVVFGDI